jgi:DNA-binding GntR family transcriptional regulator
MLEKIAPDQADRRLSDEAYDRVVEYIMTGSLPAGAVIQERSLAEELGLSRTPLRDALLLLEGEGLLVREGKRLLRVVSMDITRYMENLAIRRLLESEAARLAVGRIDPAELDQMEAILTRMLADFEAGEHPRREEVRRIDEALHSAIARAAGNIQLAEIVASLRLKTHIFDLKNMPERFRDTCREHLDIIAALRDSNNPATASAAVERHIGAVRESIIARLLPR